MLHETLLYLFLTLFQVQTGLARTGRLLAVDHEDVRPDILILGKDYAERQIAQSSEKGKQKESSK